ncbi:hypothetical protein BH11ARM2_BH11ARM2_19100 [soil metagenome]
MPFNAQNGGVVPFVAALTLAPLTYRWFYVQTNFFREEAVTEVEGLLKRAATAGYNGMVFTDTKLQSLDPYPDFYKARVKKVLQEAKALKIDVIPEVLPVGYAAGMLARNPSLVEAMPLRDVPFVVRGREAQVAPDPDIRFENGDFESADGNQFIGYAFQDGVGASTFADHAVFHGGATSLRMQDPNGGNCRIMRRVKVRPGRHYEFSAWTKTADFKGVGTVRMLVLGKDGKQLSFHDMPLQSTMDWTRMVVTFDTKANEEALLYLGSWGGSTGKLWWDDAQVKELGLMNLVRRPGCPVRVKGEDGTAYVEGQDFERLEDPRSGQIPWAGEYEVSHDSPPIRLTAASRIHDGERLKVSFSHAVSTEMGKTALCLSEPASRKLEDAEIRRVAGLFGAGRFFFGHDEIRVMNLCDACKKRNLTPGQMLAADIAADDATVRGLDPKAERFVWSDMFDPFHNAVAGYYAVDGDLAGSWKGLPKEMVVVNWNSGNPEKSLPFFAQLGHRQILAGYYDGPVDAIKDWLAKGRGQKVAGVMYTTWQNRYDDLEAFAKAAWGSG